MLDIHVVSSLGLPIDAESNNRRACGGQKIIVSSKINKFVVLKNLFCIRFCKFATSALGPNFFCLISSKK